VDFQGFPPAAQIEQGKKVPPLQLDRVSIVFSDVVGFTALLGRMAASRVICYSFAVSFLIFDYIIPIKKNGIALSAFRKEPSNLVFRLVTCWIAYIHPLII
jgi:hypothetical protein